MNDLMKKAAIDRLVNAQIQTLQLYSDIAILFNACDIAVKRYETKEDFVSLSTILNMPTEFWIETEVDIRFSRDELLDKYRTDLIEMLCVDYLIRAVTLLDACFEDLYEELLPLYNSEHTEKTIDKLVRNAWTNDNLRNFFVNDLQLKTPTGKISSFSMILDRYEELREIRHAVVHNNGILSEKHLRKLTRISENLPESIRESSSFARAYFIDSGKVKLDIFVVYLLRKWLSEMTSFLVSIFEAS